MTLPEGTPDLTSCLLARGHDWLAINKPAGIGMHSEDDVAGLVVLASNAFGQPLWPVHRLDKVTSGVLLLATSASGAARLSALFAEHKMRKYYRAQSHSRPQKKQGWIKGDMSKGRNGSWLLLRSQNNPAITRFVSAYDEASQTRTFLLHPLTGRTHQLRVAMKSLGSPIDGDQRYRGAAADRTYLHAAALCWDDEQPDGSVQRIELTCSPASGQWVSTAADWEKPWLLF
ncbi:pseudouridine synthase [Venatoribacter cucullus]|uniref:pseudouridine synthase n=1 Tax=Venatoribacter cucullus TaxID=2661630 RepID=UPI002240AE25|nr:pseudouridine synthase [Venatoribacter cucullus]UZK03422.1 RNA pseudouridine synthase [Venatoribacter cucullus]